MTNNQQNAQQGLVIYAKDKKKVAAFYLEALDLELVDSQPSHDHLIGNGCDILVHQIPCQYAEEIEIADPPEPRSETPFKPTFVVKKLKRVRLAAEESGGFLKPVSEAWEFGGFTILDGWDPEGNIVQFKQVVR